MKRIGIFISSVQKELAAEPMFLAAYAEKAGSGILDMISLCGAAGVRPPEFRQDGGQFVQTLWRPKMTAPAIVTPEVPPEVGTKSGPSLESIACRRFDRDDGA